MTTALGLGGLVWLAAWSGHAEPALSGLGIGARRGVPEFMSADGTRIAGRADGRIFVWREGDGVEWVEPPDGPMLPSENHLAIMGSKAAGFSHDGGLLAGTALRTRGPRGFLWTLESGVEWLPGTNDRIHSTVEGVSRDGKTVVGLIEADGRRRFYRWSKAAGIEVLDPRLPDGTWFIACLAGDGMAVYFHVHDAQDRIQMVRWSIGDRPVRLGGRVFGQQGEVRACSHNGSVAAGWLKVGSDDDYHHVAAVWSGRESGVRIKVAGVHVRREGAFLGMGMSPNGKFVVGGGRFRDGEGEAGAEGVVRRLPFSRDWLDGEGPEDAYIWSQIHGGRSLRDLLVAQGVDLGGWKLLEAVGVTDDGTVVVGTGRNPEGRIAPFRAVLRPWEPPR